MAKEKALSLTNFGDLTTEKDASAFIDNTITAYAKVGDYLHKAACVALFHAWKHGQPAMLNQLFKGLRVNDKAAFRLWIGKYSAVTVKQEDGSEVIYNWAGFKEESGFIVKKASANYRALVDFEGIDVMTDNLLPFWEIAVERNPTALTLEALLKMIAGFKAKVEKKSTDEGLAIPRDIELELGRLTDVSNRFLAVAATQGEA